MQFRGNATESWESEAASNAAAETSAVTTGASGDDDVSGSDRNQSQSPSVSKPPSSVSRTVSCSVCRHYRKRCDLLLPSCSRCLKRNAVCDYGSATVHISTTSGSAKIEVSKLPPKVIPWSPVKAVSCKYCYTKKLKCDKEKPSCGGCVKRSLSCEYTTNSSTTSLSPMIVRQGLADNESFSSSSSSQTGMVGVHAPAAPSSTSATFDIASILVPQLNNVISHLVEKEAQKDTTTPATITNLEQLKQEMSKLITEAVSQHTGGTSSFASSQAPNPELLLKRKRSIDDDSVSHTQLPNLSQVPILSQQTTPSPHQPLPQSLHHLILPTPPSPTKTLTQTTKIEPLVHQAAAEATTSLADIVIGRLPVVKPGSPMKRLTCARLWIIDPDTSEKVYFCPACKKDYKTSNGLKYHLGQHSDASEFPTGYYWDKASLGGSAVPTASAGVMPLSDMVVGSEDNGMEGRRNGGPSKAYSCTVEGCMNEYSSLGGLKYHILHGHTVPEDEMQSSDSSENGDSGRGGGNSSSSGWKDLSSEGDKTTNAGAASGSSSSHHHHHNASANPLDHLVQIAMVNSETIHLSKKFKSLKQARTAAKVATALASGTTLADIVIDRLPKLKPGVYKKLSCGKLWILDPESAEKLYFCPICKRMYPTANGMKYHLSNSHKDQRDFPQGYYWDKKGRSEVAEEKNIDLPYRCTIGNCQNRYSRPAGLNCHITRMHGRGSSEEPPGFFGAAGGGDGGQYGRDDDGDEEEGDVDDQDEDDE
ncbi:hypothetical protein BDR26DRAFT_918509 [Obelidium mucronatum]|nr:hypothetical protein BDR26DRAFT_918509 [Obelidium mucronatum]